MLHIAVCDDEQVEIEYVMKLISQWSSETGIVVTVSCFSSAEAFLFHYEEDKDFDILLLDIQMSGIDGIELAEKIRTYDETVQIAFITGYTDYISKGYDVSALHYLIKPVDKEKLFAVLNRAYSNLSKIEPVILFSVDDEKVKIKLSDIIYFEAFGHELTVVCKEKRFNTKLTISEISGQLDNSFIRCHRSYIVNLNHIVRITKTDAVLGNGQLIPLSRRLYNDVNRAFIDYYRGQKI